MRTDGFRVTENRDSFWFCQRKRAKFHVQLASCDQTVNIIGSKRIREAYQLSHGNASPFADNGEDGISGGFGDD